MKYKNIIICGFCTKICIVNEKLEFEKTNFKLLKQNYGFDDEDISLIKNEKQKAKAISILRRTT